MLYYLVIRVIHLNRVQLQYFNSVFNDILCPAGVSSKRNVYVPLSACLGLLCVAAVAAIVYICVRHTAVRNQLENSLHNLSQYTDLLESPLDELRHVTNQ